MRSSRQYSTFVFDLDSLNTTWALKNELQKILFSRFWTIWSTTLSLIWLIIFHNIRLSFYLTLFTFQKPKKANELMTIGTSLLLSFNDHQNVSLVIFEKKRCILTLNRQPISDLNSCELYLAQGKHWLFILVYRDRDFAKIRLSTACKHLKKIFFSFWIYIFVSEVAGTWSHRKRRISADYRL